VILAEMDPEERRKHYAADITYGTTTSSASTTCATTWPGARRVRPARPRLRHRGRGRLDPDRRGPDPADHQRPGRPDSIWYQSSPGSPAAAPRRGREVTTRSTRRSDRRHPGGRRREGRGLARHRQSLRVGQHAADQLPEQRDQGQGALHQGQGLRRHERRDPDVDEFTGRILAVAGGARACTRPWRPRRAWRSRTRTDARHDHAAELLPALREAGRDDRYAITRPTSSTRLQARRGPDPDQHAMTAPTSPTWCTRRPTPSRRPGRGHRRPPRGRPAVLVGTTSVEKSELVAKLLKRRGIAHEVLNAKYHERRRPSSPWPGTGAR